MTADIFATAFDDLSPSIRGTWWPLSKKQSLRQGLPGDYKQLSSERYPRGSKPYGSAGFNTLMFLFLLRILSDTIPFTRLDVADTARQVEKEISRVAFTDSDKIQKHLDNPRQDIGLSLPIGLAVGYYSAITNLTLDVVRDLAEGVAAGAGLPSDQRRTTMGISYLVWSLANTGYFGSEDCETLLNLGFASKDLSEFLIDVYCNAVEAEYWEKPKSDVFVNLGYSERCLAQAIWYLMRIATHLKFDVGFPTVAKENLNEVFADPFTGGGAAFLFGSLCTLSEQINDFSCYELIVPDALVSRSPYAKIVADLFDDINETNGDL